MQLKITRTNLILILLLKFTSHVIAQVKMQINIGLNYNDNYAHIGELDFDYRLSPILLGFAVNKSLNENYNLKCELEYSHKGAKHHDINYFVLSSMISRNVIDPTFSIELGPYLGHLLKYKSYGEVRNHPELKNLDFGIQFGFSKNIKIKGETFSCSIQNEVGLYRFSFSKHLVHQFKIGYQLN